MGCRESRDFTVNQWQKKKINWNENQHTIAQTTLQLINPRN